MAEKTNKNKSKTSGEEKGFDPSRRDFMKKTGIATGGVIGGTLLGGYFGNPFGSEETEPEEQADRHYSETRMFSRDTKTSMFLGMQLNGFTLKMITVQGRSD